jgi:hypothetical protein
MEEKLHRRWVKIGGKKGSIFNGNFQLINRNFLLDRLVGRKGDYGGMEKNFSAHYNSYIYER